MVRLERFGAEGNLVRTVIGLCERGASIFIYCLKQRSARNPPPPRRTWLLRNIVWVRLVILKVPFFSLFTRVKSGARSRMSGGRGTLDPDMKVCQGRRRAPHQMACVLCLERSSGWSLPPHSADSPLLVGLERSVRSTFLGCCFVPERCVIDVLKR